MTIVIEIGLGNNVPLQETTIFDYIAFTSVIFASVILTILPVAFYVKKEYILLKTRNVPQLMLMCLFGIIHIWGAFIDHDHFETSRNIQKSNCSFWGFWFQYFMGFNPWFVVLVLRHQSYLWVFSKLWQGLKTYPEFFFSKIVAGIVFVLPLFGICVFVSVWDSERWDLELGRCVTDVEWKIVLLSWIVFCLSTIAFLNVWVKWILPSLYYEYEPMNSIVRLGIEVIVVNSLISMYGLSSYSIGRTIATMLIVFLHLYSMYALTFKELYFAITNNNQAVSQFLKSHKNLILVANEIGDILDDSRICEDFIDYCVTKTSISTKGRDNNWITISPLNLVSCYKQMVNWKTSYFSETPKISNPKFTGIYENFIAKDAPYDCHLPRHIIRNIDMSAPLLVQQISLPSTVEEVKKKESKKENIFDDIDTENKKGGINVDNVKPDQTIFNDAMSWILKRLEEYWGESYLKEDIYNRDIYQLYTNQSLTNSGQTNLEQRLLQSRYLQVFQLETDIGTSFFELQEIPLFSSISGYRHFGKIEENENDRQTFAILDEKEEEEV